MSPSALKDNIFKSKGPVPPSIVRMLVVSDGGTAITEKLDHWKSRTTNTPFAVPVITVTNTTGKITASRVVVRGPLFTASETSTIPANQIWEDARDTLAISFHLEGNALKFSSDVAPNLSDWVELRTISGFKVTDTVEKRDLTEDEILLEPGVMDGACARVALQVHNVHWLAATFEVRNLTSVNGN